MLVAAAMLLAACGSATDETAVDDAVPTEAEDGTEGAPSSPASDEVESDGSTTDDPAPDNGDGSGDSDVGDDGEQTGGESTDGGNPGSSDLEDRLAAALLGPAGDGLSITADDAVCTAEGLDGRLSDRSYERLTERLEANEGLSPEDGFTPEDIAAISDVFATCMDFRPLLDEISDDFGDAGAAMLGCLEEELGVDGVEEAVLLSLTAEELEFALEQLLLTGLDTCPTETVAHLATVVVRTTFGTEQAELQACFEEVPVDAYREAVETGDLNGDFGGFSLSDQYCRELPEG